MELYCFSTEPLAPMKHTGLQPQRAKDESAILALALSAHVRLRAAMTSVDESGAPWPYEPSPKLPPAVPSWWCGHRECQCDPSAARPTSTRAFVFHNHRGQKMPGARCRVIVGDRPINLDTPFADGGGPLPLGMLKPTAPRLGDHLPTDIPALHPGHPNPAHRNDHSNHLHLAIGTRL